ncbi:MAG: 23S rRNA (guanosine(2251)-2'-O)-methyltransferase RlmB [Oscillospiraceae bacterium]|nr:23S rRNA (guanosine(2251)-2'-O)-methyltransferase RlmB [Oscillospiraceae bacterium]
MINKDSRNDDKNLVYGRNVVLELLKKEEDVLEEIYIYSGIEKSFTDELNREANSKKIKITSLDKKQFEKISSEQKSQGVVARIKPYKYSSLEDILEFSKAKEKDPFLLILDKIEDPHNLGAIIRTAEAFGIHGIILPQHRSAHINPTVYKTSAGIVSHIRICIENNINNTIDYLKKNNFWIYGADANAKMLSYNIDYKGPIALIIGNEGKGISRLTSLKCDILIKIPLYGKTESLNASVAAGIIMYDITRIRNTKSLL